MAWPRIKNSRSSAQPGTHPHDGVQATVTPAPDAEPPPGSGQNTGVGGTSTQSPTNQGGDARFPRHDRTAADGCARSGTRTPVSDETAARCDRGRPRDRRRRCPRGAAGRRARRGRRSGLGGERDAYEDVGLDYEAPRPAYSEPLGPSRRSPAERAGLDIFGDGDHRSPAETRRRSATRVEPAGDVVHPAGRGGGGEKAEPVRDKGRRAATSPPADEHEPRVSVRDLPPDVQLGFWRLRIIIMVVVGVVFGSSPGAGRSPSRSRYSPGSWTPSAGRGTRPTYVNGGSHPGARKRTSKQLRQDAAGGLLRARRAAHPQQPRVHRPPGRRADRRLRHRLGEVGPQAADQDLERQEAVPRPRVAEGPARARRVGGGAGQRDPVRRRSAPRSWSGPRSPSTGPRSRGTSPTIRNVDVFTGPALRKYLKRRGRKKRRRGPAHPRGSPHDLRHGGADAAGRCVVVEDLNPGRLNFPLAFAFRGEFGDAAVEVTHGHARSEHGGSARAAARDRGSQRGLRQADHRRRQQLHRVRARSRAPGRGRPGHRRRGAGRGRRSPASSTRSPSTTASRWATAGCSTRCRPAS